jgi:hypothetical protein
MLAGVYLLTMFRPEIQGTQSQSNLDSPTGSIEDLRRQVLSPWRYSFASIDSRSADLEGLRAGGDRGSALELASLNGNGKRTGGYNILSTSDEAQRSDL